MSIKWPQSPQVVLGERGEESPHRQRLLGRLGSSELSDTPAGGGGGAGIHGFVGGGVDTCVDSPDPDKAQGVGGGGGGRAAAFLEPAAEPPPDGFTLIDL